MSRTLLQQFTCQTCQHEDDWDYLETLREEEADATCLNCGRPVFVGEEACSRECQERVDDAIDSLGTCGGCGRYGTYGKACFRMLDGQMQECGQFV